MAARHAQAMSALGGEGRWGHPDRVQVIPLAELARIIRSHQDDQAAAASAGRPENQHDDQLDERADDESGDERDAQPGTEVDPPTDRYDIDPVVHGRRGSLDPAGCALTIGVTAEGVQVAIVTERGMVAASYRRPPTAFATEPAPQHPRTSTATPTTDDGAAAEGLFAAVCAGADAVLHATGFDPDRPTGLRGIGVLVAGRVDKPTGSVEYGPWQGFPVAERLGERYGLSVEVTTPAHALLAAEHWRGSARGRHGVLAIDWDTGIDGALALGDRILSGTTGNAGHIGHVCVDPYGPKCACGARGCLQAVAGGAAISEWYRARGGTLGAVCAERIVLAAGRGDAIAQATLRRAGEAIGQVAAGVVTLLDLDVVVIGGPLGALGPAVLDAIGDGYSAHAALGYAAAPRIVPAVLGQEGIPLGAAASVLYPQSYRAG